MAERCEEWKKMVSGEQYDCMVPELVEARRLSKRFEKEYSDTVGYSGDADARLPFLRRWLGAVGDGAVVEPPFRCDYGSNIRIGAGFYANFDCCVLDCAAVTIGDRVLFGPGVQLYTATHPLDAAARRVGESANPISIGDDVWLGGRAIVVASRREGVTIGDGAVVGAGAVVTRSIPPYSLAVGAPARVIRRLDGAAGGADESSSAAAAGPPSAGAGAAN